MSLTHDQKSYIKKNIRKSSPGDIAAELNLNQSIILDYLEKRWGKDKLQKFLKEEPENTVTLNQKSFLRNNWPYFLILFILILITFANSLSNAFLSDDIAEIVQNPYIGQFSYIFTHPFGFIRLILNWAVFHLAGLNPAFFRLINFGFHMASVFLLFTIVKMLSNQRVALFAAAAFTIHPAFAEAIVWISGGTYPQYTFFFLAALLFYIMSPKRKFFYPLSSIFYLLSFMSHPVMPLALFLVFPLFEFCFGNFKKNWAKTIPFFLIAIAYVFINLGALPERTTTLQSVHYQEKGIDNPLVLIPIAISSYLELLIFPKTLTLYHSELAFGSVQFGIRVVLTLLFLALLPLAFRKSRAYFFWLSLFWLSLAPTLTPFRFNWIVAERYLYLPSIGILVSLGLALDRLSQKRKYRYIIYALFSLAIILLSARTIIRNIDWQSEDNLWVATGKTSPSSPNTHNNLGDVYGRHGDKEGALKEFQTAIALKPNYADAYHNLANTYRELNQLDKALENYQKALEYNPNLWQSYQNIAALYFEAKKYDLAVDNLQKAISINPKNLNLRNNLGIVYLTKGDKEKAKEIFNQVLNADPQNQLARQGVIEAGK